MNELVVSLYISLPPALFADYNPSLTFVCMHTFMFVSLVLLPPYKIHTIYFNIHPSVTLIEVKQVYTHAASSFPLITTGTLGLICLLGRQGKQVWLIVRQLPVKSGWVNAPLTLQDLAKAIFLNIARDTFTGYPLPPAQNLSLNTPPPSLPNTVFQI